MSVARHLGVMYLQYTGPQGIKNIAVLALDRENDQLYMRFTTSWSGFDEDGLDALTALSVEFIEKAGDFGGNALLLVLNSSLPHNLRLTNARRICVTDVDTELSRLEQEMLSSASVVEAAETVILSSDQPGIAASPNSGVQSSRKKILWRIPVPQFAYASAAAAALVLTAAGLYVSVTLNGTVAPPNPPRPLLQVSSSSVSLPPAPASAQNSTRAKRVKRSRTRIVQPQAEVANTFTLPHVRPNVPEPLLAAPPRLTIAAIGGGIPHPPKNDDDAPMTAGPPRKKHLMVRILKTLSTPFRAVGEAIVD